MRIVWRGDLPGIRGRHLHPADVGGAIVSIDQPVPNGTWLWGGHDWVAHQDTTVVTAIAGVTIGATDPALMRARWQQCGFAHSVRFQSVTERGEGIDVLELVAANRNRAGESLHLCGVTISLV